MTEHLAVRPEPGDAISSGWGAFLSDNYYDPAPLDAAAEARAQRAFARKAEAEIAELLPGDIAPLARAFTTLARERLVEALKEAAHDGPDGPEYFVAAARSCYLEGRRADAHHVLAFTSFVQGFQRAVGTVVERFKGLPDDYFGLRHESREWLMEDVYRVAVDLLIRRLNREFSPSTAAE